MAAGQLAHFLLQSLLASQEGTGGGSHCHSTAPVPPCQAKPLMAGIPGTVTSVCSTPASSPQFQGHLSAMTLPVSSSSLEKQNRPTPLRKLAPPEPCHPPQQSLDNGKSFPVGGSGAGASVHWSCCLVTATKGNVGQQPFWLTALAIESHTSQKIRGNGLLPISF